jgi:hypothetical protein
MCSNGRNIIRENILEIHDGRQPLELWDDELRVIQFRLPNTNVICNLLFRHVQYPRFTTKYIFTGYTAYILIIHISGYRFNAVLSF